jgi:hypothetical protein
MLERKEIEETIFSDSRAVLHHKDNRYRWGEIQLLLLDADIILQPSDILEVGFTEGWDEGDSARDDAYDLTVKRKRPETDKEYEDRCKSHEQFQKISRDRRYQNFMKLKEEFEGELV